MRKNEMNERDMEMMNQRVWEYVVYMMMTGYLRQAVCRSALQEARLFLHYNDTRREQQYTLEEKADRILEQEIISELPSEFLEGRVEIRLVANCRTKLKTEIRITDGISKLILRPVVACEKTKDDRKKYVRRIEWVYFDGNRKNQSIRLFPQRQNHSIIVSDNTKMGA